MVGQSVDNLELFCGGLVSLLKTKPKKLKFFFGKETEGLRSGTWPELFCCFSQEVLGKAQTIISST